MGRIVHVGIIPDGSRRWAVAHGVRLAEAYDAALRSLTNMIAACYSRSAAEVSVYLLSKDNLRRSASDLAALDSALLRFLREQLPPLIRQWGCQVVHAGRSDQLAPSVTEELAKVCKVPAVDTGMRLNLLVGYDPWDELERAVVGGKVDRRRLWVTTPVDLVIRTAGGPIPLSNFLPLQTGYAIVRVLEALFNDLSQREFEELLTWAASIPRLRGS